MAGVTIPGTVLSARWLVSMRKTLDIQKKTTKPAKIFASAHPTKRRSHWSSYLRDCRKPTLTWCGEWGADITFEYDVSLSHLAAIMETYPI